MDKNNKNLPSEILQKEFENNPLKILETIRNEKENQNIQLESPKKGKDKISSLNNENNINHIPSNEDKNKLEESKNDSSSSNQKDDERKKINPVINNINNLNTNNNINYNNTLINYNPNINFNKNSNIIVNHLNIFFNFNNNSNANNANTTNNKDLLFVNKDINNLNCKNESISCNNNNKFDNCKNDNSFFNNNSKINFEGNDQINFVQKNENNEKKLLFLTNVNKLLNYLKSYKGSIISQAFIDNINDENEIAIFFKNIIPHLCKIMCLEYGNYFFQKLIKKLNFQQRFNIYQIIEPDFLLIATNKCGTHSIQSLMDTIQTPLEHFAINTLISKNMLLLFTDDNAYHIMMKMILDFPEEKRNVLNLYLVMNVEKIVINCNGAFCVNKFINYNKNLNLRKILVGNLKNNMKKLIFNKYSCINLLLVLQIFGVEWGNFIIKEIEENFVVLSENPVSNVFITKVLEFLKNSQNFFVLKLLIWSLYKNIILMNYLISNKNHKKLLNQLIEYSDEDQKKYLYVLLKKSNW